MEAIEMWQFLALIATLMGATFIYLSNKHQSIFIKPLNKFWRLIGLMLCLLALCIWLQVFAVSSAIFIWLFTLSVTLICIVLLTLIPFFSKNQS